MESLSEASVKRKLRHKNRNPKLKNAQLLGSTTAAWTDPDDLLVDNQKKLKLTELPTFTLPPQINRTGGLGTFAEDASSSEEEDADKTAFKTRIIDLGGDASVRYTAVDFHPTQEAVLYATKHTISVRRVRPEKIAGDLYMKKFENINIKHAIFARPDEIWVATTDPGFMYIQLHDQSINQVRPRSSTKPIWKFASNEDGSFVAVLLTNYIVVVYNALTKEPEELPAVQDAQSMCFNGDCLFIMTSTGKFYELSLSTRKVKCFEDHVDIGGTTIAVSNEHIACGSESGIVSLYKRGKNGDKLTLAKTFKSLDKSVQHMKFNRDGSVLVFATEKPNPYFIMAHIPTMQTKTLYYKGNRVSFCNDLAFSPHGKYFICVNRGQPTLLEISHYNY